METFNLDEAVTNLSTICGAYKGTAAEHEYLKKTLQTIYEKLKKLSSLEAEEARVDESSNP